MVLDWILGKWSCKGYYWENLETLTIDYILDNIALMLFLKCSQYVMVMWETDFGTMKNLLNTCGWSVISASNFQMFSKMYMHMFICIHAQKCIYLDVYVHVSMCVCNYVYIENTHRKRQRWEFPRGSVVRILCFHCRGYEFDPWSGN